MQELKLGDYVRTRYGDIGQIFEEFRGVSGNKIYKIDKPDGDFDYTDVFTFDIIKSAEGTPKGLMSLIEVGDYVNGCLIVEINEDTFIKGQINLWTNMIISEGEPFPNEYYKAKILEKDIKSVVTKEQFESISYKL